MDLEPPQLETAAPSRLKRIQGGIKTKFESLAKWWATEAKPALLKALAAIVSFYKTKVHPILAMKASPEKRAIAAGRYLCRLAISYGILSVIGSIILALITTEGECVLQFSFSDSCSEYATERPFLTWAIVSLLVSLIVASFLFAFGSYVEAKMRQ